MSKNAKRIIRIIINVTISMILTTLVLFILFIFLNKAITKDDAISFNGYYVFFVSSGSMKPELQIGDVIVVKKEPKYEVGDIVTYKLDKAYITHRIIDFDGNMVILKGDANSAIDDPVNIRDIQGKFQKKLVLFKYLYALSQNKLFIITLVFVIIIINLLDYLKNKKDRKV